jgi:hypothetical protein
MKDAKLRWSIQTTVGQLPIGSLVRCNSPADRQVQYKIHLAQPSSDPLLIGPIWR